MKISFFSCLLIIALSASIFAQTAALKPLQSFVVTTKNWSAVEGKAQLFERKNDSAEWEAIGNSFPVVVGSGGR